jgi:SAM-dependent methyltransferase
MFSDLAAATYDEAARNTWHDGELATGTESFYGDARALAHERFLERFPPSGSGRLLDVGCGLGYFVARALSAGWDAYGCDTSASWAAHARELVGEQRIACAAVDAGLSGGGLFGGGFDLVTSWDVLEHIHDPLPFLRTIAALLAPGGRAFIRTPNLTWIQPTYAMRRWLAPGSVELGPLNHVVYYTAATLARALRLAGLEPVAWPVLPPPQVGIGNRVPAAAGRSSPVTRAKNLHAAGADRLARVTRGRFVTGQDLDVVAVRMPERSATRSGINLGRPSGAAFADGDVGKG